MPALRLPIGIVCKTTAGMPGISFARQPGTGAPRASARRMVRKSDLQPSGSVARPRNNGSWRTQAWSWAPVLQCEYEVSLRTGAPGLRAFAPSPPQHPEKPSRRGAVVIAQHAAQALAAPHGSTMTRCVFRRYDQPIAETLVVSLTVIIQNEFVNSVAQRAPAKGLSGTREMRSR